MSENRPEGTCETNIDLSAMFQRAIIDHDYEWNDTIIEFLKSYRYH